MSVKHNKIKNTGILFELLVRKITSETLSNKNSKAIGILKKYFTKTELGKEYKLYETLIKNKGSNSNKAETVLSSLLEVSKKLNQEKLKKEKYNLIKEIKKHYEFDEFFKIKLPNYKIYASFSNLLEIQNNPTSDKLHLNDIISNKSTLLEYLIESPKIEHNVAKKDIFEEFKNYDRDIRILSYKILLEKFNEKYKDLNYFQKRLLKEFIETEDSAPKLKSFYNSKIKEVKKQIKEENKKTQDPATKIKVEGTLVLLEEISPKDKINLNKLASLMNYYGLLYELKMSNK